MSEGRNCPLSYSWKCNLPFHLLSAVWEIHPHFPKHHHPQVAQRLDRLGLCHWRTLSSVVAVPPERERALTRADSAKRNGYKVRKNSFLNGRARVNSLERKVNKWSRHSLWRSLDWGLANPAGLQKQRSCQGSFGASLDFHWQMRCSLDLSKRRKQRHWVSVNSTR